MNFDRGDQIRLPGERSFVTIDMLQHQFDGGVEMYVLDSGSHPRRVRLSAAQVRNVVLLSQDGAADPKRVLAGLWSQWMCQAAESVKGTALGSAPLNSYLHQHEAVYGAMLPQPRLRFLLADEPGTGKTIMAALYLTEASRLGIVNRALIVCPAHLVGKWQDDFSRFFGRELRRITSNTIREHAFEGNPHPLWIVSLQLAAINPKVQAAIDPDRAGWDFVVADEAHRLTPTAQTFFQVGLTVLVKAPRALLMTATPHRGSEYLFRSLMYLTDPQVFPLPGEHGEVEALRRLRPGSVHFLRRMKEGLVDVDGITPLFKKRTAYNIPIALNLGEKVIYDEALALVDAFFPERAVGLGRMVYGKRAASSLFALRETLLRRRLRMGTPVHPDETMGISEEDTDEQELIEISHFESRSSREEKRRITELVERIDQELAKDQVPVSKWPRLEKEVLLPNGVASGGDEQLVVFTEYADTAEWLARRFQMAGYQTEMYSGRQTPAEREEIRARFIAGDFQVIVSTDAGNEGIDLQSARVLVNWDVPWSLVTLEQRFGRIHRVGQTRDVHLYNLIAVETREGDAHTTLLDNLVAAANELDGKMFDSLAVVGELLLSESAGVEKLEDFLSSLYQPSADQSAVTSAIQAMTKERIRQIHAIVQEEDQSLAAMVDVGQAIAGVHQQHLNKINPQFVERYLTRLDHAGLLQLTRSSVADQGLWYVKPAALVSLPFGSPTGTLIATSGDAKRAAVRQGAVSAEKAIPLGPNDEDFRNLVEQATRHLHADLYQGGAMCDPTAITDYRLYCFTVSVDQGRTVTQPEGWRHHTRWSYLVKADAVGLRVVPWEILANLEAAESQNPRAPHPGELTNANAQARHAANKDTAARRAELGVWLDQARVQLQKLPNDLTDDITNNEDRTAARQQVTEAVNQRIATLEASVEFKVGDVELTGWGHVTATATPDSADEDADSEVVSMRHVISLLSSENWSVADVHTEKLGYDLHATRGSKVRAVEVKGRRDSAASSGITLTGAELTTAAQLGRNYWLYVVDNCANGTGELFGKWRDPVTVFAGATKDIPVFRIKGSDLSAAKERAA
ncbi:MAG: helicase-related protein [bacterium]|nr:helicase-related protein [bacterium]MDE0600400.1 helicase-related protein [bacterium]